MVKISVIVPVYNVEKYISKCLLSLKQQTYSNIEVLIVDDGTKDNSIKIAEEIIGTDSRFKIMHKENGGLGDARNYGVLHSTGDFLSFIDSDDFIDPDFFESAADVIEKENCDLVIFDFIRYFSDEKQIVKKCNFVKLDKYSAVRTISNACNKIIRKSVWVDNDLCFPVGLWYEDIAVIPAILSYTSKIGYVEHSHYYYRMRDESITNQSGYNKKVMDILSSFDFLKTKISENFDKKELEFLMVSHIIYLGTQRVIEYNRREEFSEMIRYVETDFPDWKNNPLLRNLSMIKRVYVFFASHENYFMCNKMVEFRRKFLKV